MFPSLKWYFKNLSLSKNLCEYPYFLFYFCGKLVNLYESLVIYTLHEWY